MPEVPEGTVSCQVYGDALLAKQYDIAITLDGKPVRGFPADLCDKALARLIAAIDRCLEPSKPRKKKGESND